jgi:hypothetical protein
MPKLTAIASVLLASTTLMAADWSDTEVQVLHGAQFRDVSNNNPHNTRDIVTLQHASGYKYGRNFFFVDASKASQTSNNDNFNDIYLEYYHTLSFTKIAGKDWSRQFIKDVGFTAGVNYGTNNSAFRPSPKVLLFGPTFDLNIPGFAFFNVDVLSYKDNGTFRGFGSGRLCGNSNTTYQLTPVWKLPFQLGSAKFNFEGFMDIIGDHGTCKTQVLTQPQLRWDVGNHFGKPDSLYLGIEYQYWHNKFGINNRNESFPQALLVWKL